MRDDVQLQEDMDYMSSCVSIARIFSSLLQQAWLLSLDPMVWLLTVSLKF